MLNKPRNRITTPFTKNLINEYTNRNISRC